ncbi:MAG: metallophosphoesterase [Planctomycetota bacterium]
MTRISRRRFLRGALGVGAAGVATAGYAVGIEPVWEKVRHLKLPLRGLSDTWRGWRVVQVSDLHAGPRVSPAYLRRTLASLAGLKPDLVLVTGDWVTMHDRVPVDRLDDAMRALVAATVEQGVPVVGCLGNHDYGHAWTDRALANELAERLCDWGVMLLRNDVTEIDGLYVAGVDDLWSPDFSPAAVAARLPEDRDALVLCHNPDGIDTPAFGEGRWAGVMVSGHTHGGQCRFPLVGRPILPMRNHRYAAGWVDVSPMRKLYVNVGLGHSHRVRFGVRPEVTVFELVAAS